MKALVISVLGTGALVALAAPRFGDAVPRNKPTPAASAPEADLALATKPAWYGGEMTLEREGDGHFYANVSVDGSDYRMLIDTGASVVALTADDAHSMGLDWDPNALAPVARGVGGTVLGVPVTIKAMAVGDFEAQDVKAVIIPDGLAISLLGQSFLSHIPKVDISEDKLTLSN